MTMRAYEITWSGVLAGQFVQTVQHVCADEPTDPNPFAMAQNIVSPANFDPVNNLFLDMLPADYTLTSVRCRRVFGGTGPTAVFLASVYDQQSGTRGTGISAAQVNPVILWIPTTEPSKLGRLFVPGVAEDDIDNMALSSTLITAIDAFAAAWIDGVEVSPDFYQGCVAERATSTPFNVISVDVIAYSQISPLIGTQRRRLRPV